MLVEEILTDEDKRPTCLHFSLFTPQLHPCSQMFFKVGWSIALAQNSLYFTSLWSATVHSEAQNSRRCISAANDLLKFRSACRPLFSAMRMRIATRPNLTFLKSKFLCNMTACHWKFFFYQIYLKQMKTIMMMMMMMMIYILWWSVCLSVCMVLLIFFKTFFLFFLSNISFWFVFNFFC